MATTPTTTTPTTTAPQQPLNLGRNESLATWAGPYVTNMLGQAQAWSSLPYATYSGPLTAGASQLQQNLFQGLGGIQFPSNLGGSFTNTDSPTLPSASLNGPTATTSPGGIASAYMNPYLQAVLAPQLAEMQRQAKIMQNQNAGKLAQAGAFGGSRQAIMDSELQRNLLDKMSSTIGTGYASAFDRAREQWNTEQTQGNNLATMIGNAGELQRGIEAQGIAADKAEFEQQRDYPMKMLQFQQSMLQGLPVAAFSNNYQQPNSTADLAGSIGGLLGLYEKLFPGTTTT